jgi:hypothetical protein
MKERLLLDRIDVHGNRIAVSKRIKRAVLVYTHRAGASLAYIYNAPAGTQNALDDIILYLFPIAGNARDCFKIVFFGLADIRKKNCDNKDRE